MAASRTGVVGVPSDVDVTCVLSFTSAFATQRRWVMIKTNFQPKIGLKQPNALTQRSQPSIWVEKTTQRFLECWFIRPNVCVCVCVCVCVTHGALSDTSVLRIQKRGGSGLKSRIPDFEKRWATSLSSS